MRGSRRFAPPLWEQLEGISNNLTSRGLKADDCYLLAPAAEFLTFGLSTAQTHRGLARAEKSQRKRTVSMQSSQVLIFVTYCKSELRTRFKCQVYISENKQVQQIVSQASLIKRFKELQSLQQRWWQ
ncbi:hypothetical protein PAMP_006706 [Pampus punctatissimus]